MYLFYSTKQTKMKILYIDSKQKNLNTKISKEEILKLPKKLFLAYSLQYKDLANEIKKQLLTYNIKIEKYEQVLGCSKINTKLPVFLISTGRFHAINLFLQVPEVYVLEGNIITKVSKKEIEKVNTRKRTALIKFLSAENIGILVSTKPGQENLKQALALKKKLKKKSKQAQVFLTNNINIGEFENFQIDSWVNTACPGLERDNSSIINIEDLPKL